MTNEITDERPARNSNSNAEQGQLAIVPPAKSEVPAKFDWMPQREGRFDWSANNEDVVIRTQPETAIYVNTIDQIVIRQNGGYDDDTITILNLESVPAFISRLQDVAQELASEPSQ